MELWTRYHDTGDLALRNRLVMAYAPLVKWIVFKKVRELPAHCELEDFISCGLESLMASLNRYDPSRGATLGQFLWTRVNGAVIDELRRQDWAPRSLRRWERDISKAHDEFFVIYHRHPTPDELAQALGIDQTRLARLEADIVESDITSLNGLLATEDPSTVERLALVTASDSDPEESAMTQAAHETVRRAIGNLSERERAVAVLLYVYELKLHEVGDVIGVTESRVWQLHRALKQNLREALGADQELLLEAV